MQKVPAWPCCQEKSSVFDWEDEFHPPPFLQHTAAWTHHRGNTPGAPSTTFLCRVSLPPKASCTGINTCKELGWTGKRSVYSPRKLAWEVVSSFSPSQMCLSTLVDLKQNLVVAMGIKSVVFLFICFFVFLPAEYPLDGNIPRSLS